MEDPTLSIFKSSEEQRSGRLLAGGSKSKNDLDLDIEPSVLISSLKSALELEKKNLQELAAGGGGGRRNPPFDEIDPTVVIASLTSALELEKKKVTELENSQFDSRGRRSLISSEYDIGFIMSIVENAENKIRRVEESALNEINSIREEATEAINAILGRNI